MAKTSAAIRKKEKIGELEQKGKRSGERAAEITFIYVTFFLVSSNLTWHSKLSLMPGQHKILELPTPNLQQSTRLNILYILQVIESFLLIKNIHTHAYIFIFYFPHKCTFKCHISFVASQHCCEDKMKKLRMTGSKIIMQAKWSYPYKTLILFYDP